MRSNEVEAHEETLSKRKLGFDISFHSLESFRFRQVFVKIIEGVATRYKTVARRICTIAESSANPAAVQCFSRQDISAKIGIGENHSADASEIHGTASHSRFSGVGQKFLETSQSRGHDVNPRTFFLQSFFGEEMTGDIVERVLRSQVAVGDREIGGPLHVDVVVGAPDGATD